MGKKHKPDEIVQSDAQRRVRGGPPDHVSRTSVDTPDSEASEGRISSESEGQSNSAADAQYRKTEMMNANQAISRSSIHATAGREVFALLVVSS
jgi:hypothetical protein